MKYKPLLPILAIAAGFAGPASAAIFIDGISSTSAVSSDNDFASDLDSNYSYTLQSDSFSHMSLTAPARITFYALASESGYTNSFSAGNAVNGTESNFPFDTSRILGSAIVASGLVVDAKFTSNVGVEAPAGDPHFTIFLPTGFTGTSFSSDWVVFGYDDTIGGDSDYDDFIVGAKISAIPEPQVWGLMIAGFGLVGLQLRRNRKRGVAITC